MKHKAQWRPTKYQPNGDKWVISRNSAELSPASSISATLALNATLPALAKHVRGDLADFGCGTAPFYGAYQPLTKSVSWIDWPSSPHETQHLDVVADLNQPVDLPADQFLSLIHI